MLATLLLQSVDVILMQIIDYAPSENTAADAAPA
jgi:hypothetical protein